MPKRLIQRWLPDPATLKEHKHLRLFGKLLLDANLWHLNRRSAAGAFAVEGKRQQTQIHGASI
ncbi:DUF2062 domain-containing protein [Aeromonas hydrophila]|uniref:DUF2062 domain-containing protein n=1 Tax=Aeromonas hydrophila TaxID=644 RepID=UPI0009550751|nr:DUF2062 domain-containing protein [Aeromonas hydrophila]SIQ68664.1 hypothetical protein SAMN05878295_103513 [Aeromonas hydrophila]SIQ72227.1 hypothetical protein SAMN05880569_103513 [Aeromonas hydrophila]